MENESKVIYFDNKEFEKRISMNERLIPGVESVVNELEGLGIKAPTIENIASLQSSTAELKAEWRKDLPPFKDSFEKFQADQYEKHLEEHLLRIARKVNAIPTTYLKYLAGSLQPTFSIRNFDITSEGKVTLSRSFIEETRDEFTVYADTPEKIKALDLSEKACKALNELQIYLKKLAGEGCVGIDPVYLDSANNSHLVAYDYEDKELFYVNKPLFEYVGLKPRKRNTKIVEPK
jgi:hypothetical protein